MSHWNYRVIKSKDGEDDYYQVHSIYYNDNSEISAKSLHAAKAGGNTLEELRSDLQRMLEALDKPIIDETTPI